MKSDRDFPYGFESWIETYYEIVSLINLNKSNPVIEKIIDDKGIGGLHEFAKQLTHEFEIKYKDTEWDGEYFNMIEEFISNKLNDNSNLIQTLVNKLNEL